MENNKEKKKTKDKVVAVEPANVGEYIIYKMEDGEEVPVMASTAFDRFTALLNTLSYATEDSLDQDQYERSIWLAVETLKACVGVLKREGKIEGKHKKTISDYEKKLLKIEKEFKNRPSKSSKNRIYLAR